MKRVVRTRVWPAAAVALHTPTAWFTHGEKDGADTFQRGRREGKMREKKTACCVFRRVVVILMLIVKVTRR